MVLAPAPLNLRLLAQRGREAHLQGVVSSYSAGGALVPRRPTAGSASTWSFPVGSSTSLTTTPGWLTRHLRKLGSVDQRTGARGNVRSRPIEYPSLGPSSDATSSTTHSGPSVSVTSSRPSSAERRRRPYLVAAFRTPSNAEPERTSTRRPGSTLPPLITATVRREVGSSSL